MKVGLLVGYFKTWEGLCQNKKKENILYLPRKQSCYNSVRWRANTNIIELLDNGLSLTLLTGNFVQLNLYIQVLFIGFLLYCTFYLVPLYRPFLSSGKKNTPTESVGGVVKYCSDTCILLEQQSPLTGIKIQIFNVWLSLRNIIFFFLPPFAFPSHEDQTFVVGSHVYCIWFTCSFPQGILPHLNDTAFSVIFCIKIENSLII